HRFASAGEAALRRLRSAASDVGHRLAAGGELLRLREGAGYGSRRNEVFERRRQELDAEQNDRARLAVLVIDWYRMKHSAFLLLRALSCRGAEVKLPPPFATPSSTNRPRVIAQPAGAQLHVPDGFSIELFAEGFEQPRYMTLGPSNEILLTDSKGGTVYIL